MPQQSVTTLTVESIDKYLNWLSVRGKSEQTLKAYGTDLKIFLLEMNLTSVPVGSFEQQAMNWLNAKRRIVSPKTTNRRLNALRSWARWVHIETPLADYSAPTPARTEPHPLPGGIYDLRKMIASTQKDQQRALIALCGLCGLRISEALSIRPSDIDLIDRKLIVRGKGDKTRIVPISNEAWEILKVPMVRAFCDNNAQIVGLKDRFARRIITNLGFKAQITRPVSSHDLRATFATAVYNKTKDQRVVQELLGHASGVTTEIYIGVADKLAEAVEL